MFAFLRKEIRAEGLARFVSRFWVCYAGPSEYAVSSLFALLIAYGYHGCLSAGRCAGPLAFAIAWAATAGLSHPLDRFMRSTICAIIAGVLLDGVYDVIVIAANGILAAGIASVPDNVRAMPLARNGLYRVTRTLWAFVVFVLSSCLFALVGYVSPAFARSLSSSTSESELSPVAMSLMTACIVGGLLSFRPISRLGSARQTTAAPSNDRR